MILTDKNDSIDAELFYGLFHVMVGNNDGKEVKGAHYFNSKTMRIVELIATDQTT